MTLPDVGLTKLSTLASSAGVVRQLHHLPSLALALAVPAGVLGM